MQMSIEQKIGRALKIYLRTLKKKFCYESDDYFFYDIKIVVIHLVRPFFEQTFYFQSTNVGSKLSPSTAHPIFEKHYALFIQRKHKYATA